MAGSAKFRLGDKLQILGVVMWRGLAGFVTIFGSPRIGYVIEIEGNISFKAFDGMAHIAGHRFIGAGIFLRPGRRYIPG